MPSRHGDDPLSRGAPTNKLQHITPIQADNYDTSQSHFTITQMSITVFTTRPRPRPPLGHVAVTSRQSVNRDDPSRATWPLPWSFVVGERALSAPIIHAHLKSADNADSGN